MTITPSQWYVRTKNGASGPYSTLQIKDFANNGKLPRQASIAKTPDGPWTPADNVKGLFPASAPPIATHVEGDNEVRASDFVPDVVKNSANALTSAVSGISKSLIAQVKRVETGIANRVDAATSSLNTLCADGQDPTFVAKIASRVNEEHFFACRVLNGFDDFLPRDV